MVNSYLPVIFLGPARRVRFCCYLSRKPSHQEAVGMATESSGSDTLSFLLCLLDLGNSLPCLPPRPKQPIIIFYIHCVSETNMFFIVLFLTAGFPARENTLLVPGFPDDLSDVTKLSASDRSEWFGFPTPRRRLLAGVVGRFIEWTPEGVLISELLRANSFCPR